MNFTALTYFVVKLAYANASTSEYKERLLFRSVESLGKQFRFWETDITPDMTESEEFVVVLHARSSSLGAMAIINEINLQMAKCNETGNFLCRAQFMAPQPQIATKEFISSEKETVCKRIRQGKDHEKSFAGGPHGHSDTTMSSVNFVVIMLQYMQ